MPQWTPPSPEFRPTFIEAMAEFSAEGRGGWQDSSSIGEDLRRWSARWHDPDGFADYAATLRADERADTPRPPHRVPCTTRWWVEGSTWLGRIAVRHRLTPALLETGGHIGYDVRPSARRLGHATAMLQTLLPHLAQLNIHRALVTCDVDNEASRRVIEANGGQLEDQRAGKLRYWIAVDQLP